ncbi:hypothetical protein [Streptomyces sp. NPDC058653]|uniref:hypothetical protein n=1 Tax=Streptomyces sp. NPDC058653 TaxID=3346576 RepID=UPI00365CB990
MASQFDGRDEQDHRQSWDEDQVREHAEEESAQYRADGGACGRDQREAEIGAEDGEAAVAAVAGEGHEHGRQRDQEGEAACGFDVLAEQQHDRGISSSPLANRAAVAPAVPPTARADPGQQAAAHPMRAGTVRIGMGVAKSSRLI